MIAKSYAKLNIFLKITGYKDGFHTIASRFVKFEDLFDLLEFEKKENPKKGFELYGNFDCLKEENLIFKAYNLLLRVAAKALVESFFADFELKVTKNIPTGGGFGGGSSNAASFLKFCNDALSLGFDYEELAKLSTQIGSDVPFFVYGFKSANVSGIGDVVEEFDDDLPKFDIKINNIFCSSKEVYAKFKNEFSSNTNINLANILFEKRTKEILQNYDNFTLNDLLKPALSCYKELEIEKNWFLSGSGSGMFRMKNV